MTKSKQKVNSAKICRRILDTKDVVKTSFMTTLLAEGVSQDKVKTYTRNLDAILTKQFDALIDATQNELG